MSTLTTVLAILALAVTFSADAETKCDPTTVADNDVIDVKKDCGATGWGRKDDTDAIRRALSLGAAGRKPVYFPKGTYLVTGPLLDTSASATDMPDPVVIRGAGPSVTSIVLDRDLPGALFRVSGYYNAKTQKQRMAGLTVEDISINGGNHRADAFHITSAAHARFERVVLADFVGRDLVGEMFWDSVFEDVQFIRSGDASRSLPAVVLKALDGNDIYTNSNNIQFTNCRFENNRWVQLVLREHTSKVRIIGCKFHGTLPEPLPYDHIEIYESHANMISTTNFVNGGGSAIVLRNADHNVINGNVLAAIRKYGILFAGERGSGANVVSSNSIQPFRGALAPIGNIGLPRRNEVFGNVTY